MLRLSGAIEPHSDRAVKLSTEVLQEPGHNPLTRPHQLRIRDPHGDVVTVPIGQVNVQ